MAIDHKAMPQDVLLSAFRQTRAGCGFPDSLFADDIAAGFRANPDGTINLISYTAWLLDRHGYTKKPD